MGKFPGIKIYIFLILLVSAFFIGLNLVAQIEQTPWILRAFLKGEACPNFTDINHLTMKDTCTGLVWARHESPTYKISNDPTPGYNWEQAKNACENLAPAGMFRLPTVAELLTLVKYQCQDPGSCSAMLDRSIVDELPGFSNATYWTIDNFNQPASWTNPQAVPPGKEVRDYKRSVNLLNGKADNPVYNKEMRLNAWCIVNRTPEIVEKKFTSANLQGIANGQQVTGGELKIVYNRNCANDLDCTNAGVGTICETINNKKYCVKYENVSFESPRVVSCNAGYHVEGQNCVVNPTTPTDDCPAPELVALGIGANEIWKGSIFNGHRICVVNSCPDGYHVDFDTFLCVENKRDCFLSASGACKGGDNDGQLCSDDNMCPGGQCINWLVSASQDWNADQGRWEDCRVQACLYDAIPDGAVCKCEAAIRDGYCTTCTGDNHLDIDNNCVSNIGSDCSTDSEIKTWNWQGGLIEGYWECVFQSCKAGYHEEDVPGVCIPNEVACSQSAELDSYGWVLSAKQIWNEIQKQWGSCNALTCAALSILSGSDPTTCECVTSGDYTSNPIVRDRICAYCGNNVLDFDEKCDTGAYYEVVRDENCISDQDCRNLRTSIEIDCIDDSQCQDNTCLDGSCTIQAPKYFNTYCGTADPRKCIEILPKKVPPLYERKIDIVFIFNTNTSSAGQRNYSMSAYATPICAVANQLANTLFDGVYYLDVRFDMILLPECSNPARPVCESGELGTASTPSFEFYKNETDLACNNDSDCLAIEENSYCDTSKNICIFREENAGYYPDPDPRTVDGCREWGPGIIDIITNRQWLDGGLKLIIPVSTQGPLGGTIGESWLGWKDAGYNFLTNKVIPSAQDNQVMISPIYLESSPSDSVETAINNLASQTGGAALYSLGNTQEAIDAAVSALLSPALIQKGPICDDITGDGIMDCVWTPDCSALAITETACNDLNFMFCSWDAEDNICRNSF
ncbi:MAG TPA: DUF1566 domain-containing protein [Candidatus Uhrbacteria bacterium]|nr:DUF1566 domain-containing protein [Candidatus Uhrbacteria bacterium]